ncbi:hypothetical protein JP28_08065 [Gallibacterium anatis]|uniref:DUF4224 domain-containing protein n=3 Tax=Gallibacterium anatis TaxID=750 RepID=U1GZX9_9PAST|nr:DUF4224 domain-containing protein [Gallibacterium anatis]ERF78068.1 hypothetical protein N561_08140 [Gallibacterium anatis 12656/12]KGQ43558.1 hypothetical protein JP28_08065 [Gallibacterium anatis]KGQ49393.1 hypothetical protein JL04_05850 [Gallibacterium anatis]KGQ53154.1 hypothetical protein IO46_04250 [Gallibacterium anatis]KGQ59655.1 hypothetical protein IO45_05725 [Gallibacterium anatis]
METTLFLSKEEIEYLTGRKQKTAIIAQLKKMAVKYKCNANGYPVVLRNQFEKRATDTSNKPWQPSV